MKILLWNLRSQPISIDIPMPDGDPIRGVIPLSGSLDVGNRIDIEEANINPEIRRLYKEGYIDITVETDADDIEPLIAAEGGEISGVPSTPLPWLAEVNPSMISIVSHPSFVGMDSHIKLRDDISRKLTYPKFIDLAVTGMGGIDTGVETPNAWYYVYTGVQNANDSNLLLTCSLTPPPTGPSNLAIWKYIGAFRNQAGNIIPFHQTSFKFSWASSRSILTLGPTQLFTEPSPIAVDLSDFAPLTAGDIYIQASLKATAGGNGLLELFVDGHQSSPCLYPVMSSESGWAHILPEFPVPGIPKRLYRRIEEFTGDLDTLNLFSTGWNDMYLMESTK